METIEIDGVTVRLLPALAPKPLALRPRDLEILQYMRANPRVASQVVAVLHGISPQQLNTLKRKLEAVKLLPVTPRAQKPRTDSGAPLGTLSGIKPPVPKIRTAEEMEFFQANGYHSDDTAYIREWVRPAPTPPAALIDSDWGDE